MRIFLAIFQVAILQNAAFAQEGDDFAATTAEPNAACYGLPQLADRVIPTMEKTWRLVMQVRPNGVKGVYTNLVDVRQTSDNQLAEEGRLARMMLVEDSTKVSIQFWQDGIKQSVLQSDPLEMDVWSTVEIRQDLDSDSKYYFSMWVNGIKLRSTENTQPEIFNNVHVFLGTDGGTLIEPAADICDSWFHSESNSIPLYGKIVAPTTTTTTSADEVAIICADQNVGEATCPEGTVINVSEAIFGRIDGGSECPQTGSQTCALSRDVTATAKEACNNRNGCKLIGRELSALYGDPCQGVRKYTRITFSCQKELSVVDQRCHGGCVGKAHYTANGSCPEECGEGGYCCREPHDEDNMCSIMLKSHYTFPSTGRHYCLSKAANNILAADNAADKSQADQCPSDECWEWNTVTSACDLKVSTTDNPGCDYSVMCSHEDGMALKMNNALFGSDATSEFNDANGADCDPVWSSATNQFEWTQPLGACGQTLTRKDDHIIFTKTITLKKEDEGIEVGTSGLKLFTSADSHGVSVTFKCKFATTATATSAELGVKQRLAVSGTAAEATGIWDNSMTLKYYTDETFYMEMDSNSLNVFLGTTLFVRSSWTVTSLADSLRYYISQCTVKNMADLTSVAIVDGTCYAAAVGAAPLGLAAVNSPTGKIVETNSDFKYKSFSFGSSGAGRQELECTVNFCIVNSETNDNGQTDCPDISHVSGGAACPTTPGFNFVAGR